MYLFLALPDANPDYSGTSRDQWTFADVFFETAGWRLVEASEASMTWHGALGRDDDAEPRPRV